MADGAWHPVAEEIEARDALHAAGRACCRLGFACAAPGCDRRGFETRDEVIRSLYDESILVIEGVRPDAGAHLRKYLLTDGENVMYKPPPGAPRMEAVVDGDITTITIPGEAK